jgi:DNA-binding response OmpR family regulator
VDHEVFLSYWIIYLKIADMAGETILLVEDNDAVALGLIYGLEQQGFLMTRADTVAAARRLALTYQFDLIILDIRLPDGSGFDLCRELRQSGQRLPILMLTARDDISDKVIGLEMGADDYVTKPFELQELVARIRALIRRSFGSLATTGPSKINIGDLSIDLTNQRTYRQQEEIHLTPTEYRILAYLVQNPHRIVNRSDLSRQIWGTNEFADEIRSIDVHIRNLRSKIEPEPSNPRIIVTVRGAGYRCNTRAWAS